MTMSSRVLVTGSEGLVGKALRAALEARGLDVLGLDLLGQRIEKGDVRNAQRVRAAVAWCDGVVHLAAISRVIWAERDPKSCWSTNVGGLRNVVEAALESRPRPWFIFASSREVYGQSDHLPVTEEALLRPMNVYGRSKLEGERMVGAAVEAGLRAAIVRLSNVYGSTGDHADRVVPAFARAAAVGADLRVDGAGNTFDFTHIEDTIRGIVAVADILDRGSAPLPPIHLLTGRPTTLGELAALAVRLGGTRSSVVEGPPRSYDVSRFFGTPARAADLLGWAPRVALVDGLRRLIEDFRVDLGVGRQVEAVP
jgi:nucleoside-diphosphate-sugar epimerase